MADSSAQPQVVATIEPNRWSMMHADLHVTNTGNATAYDIQLSFDPALDGRRDRPVPLQKVSLLRPGQSTSSYLSEFGPMMDKTYTVTLSWLRQPSGEKRETNVYQLDITHLEGITRLGASDPMIQIAEQLKHLREDWKYVATGYKRLGVDVFTAADRLHERRVLERSWRRQSAPASEPAPTDAEPTNG